MSYKADLTTLAHALIYDKKAAMLPLIKTARHNECPPEMRLGAYTNGYAIRLEEATEMDYAALSHYMGKEALERAVADYVRATPSVFWDLNLYSIAFADFLKTYMDDKAAHALAALESALIEVFWLPDSKPLLPDALSSLSEEALAAQNFTLRDACKLMTLEYAADAYLTAFRAGENPERLEKRPEYLCLIRNRNRLDRLVLEPQEYALLKRLEEGAAFGDALNEAADADRLAARLPDYLARWLSSGFFADRS